MATEETGSVHSILSKLDGLAASRWGKALVEILETKKQGAVRRILNLDPAARPTELAVWQGRHAAYQELLAIVQEPVPEDEKEEQEDEGNQGR